MEKIFVVIQITAERVSVLGAFTTRQDAEERRNLFESDGIVDIHEMTINEAIVSDTFTSVL